jgi:flagellar biosynthesis chaperone FliJ
MTNESNNKNVGGRPKGYDPRLVHQIIAEGLKSGMKAADLDAAYVKSTMCNEHNVKDTFRKEPFEQLVSSCHAEFAEAENKILVDALPIDVAPAIDKVVVAAGRELLLLLARQNAVCQENAEEACVDLRADKRNAQFRINELEVSVADQQHEIEEIGKRRDKAEARAVEAEKQAHAAQAELDRLRRETNSIDRLLAELRKPSVRNDIRTAFSEIIAKPASVSENTEN